MKADSVQGNRTSDLRALGSAGDGLRGPLMESRCVILDIGGVLEITPPTGWLHQWDERLGLPLGSVDRRLDDVWQAGAVGTITATQVRSQVGARLSLDAMQVESFMSDLWEEYLGTPNVELIEYVRGLRSRCRLGILSNSFVGARELETAMYQFDELVEQILYSHEIGVCKPDRQAFDMTCARLEVRPADCLFIDDYDVNIEAARAAGLQAHLFEGNEQTIARIAALLDSATSLDTSHGAFSESVPVRPVPASEQDGRNRFRSQ
ncbi:HAD family hydrolase [Streptomyces sp. NPDC050988]|uniref:HAD family hydrolase n=1 Tax=Streptomyces sp. NPDC050988 TaxID=3365637 RepID=UPI0037BD1A87